MDLVQSACSSDANVAAAAMERLCQVAEHDGVLLAALGGHARLLPRLCELLGQAPQAGACAVINTGGDAAGAELARAAAAGERLRMAAAFLVSQLAGKAPAIDARLLDQRFVPALAAAAIAPAGDHRTGWGRRRGALRALSKLLAAQPACAAAQLLACGGVGQVAALLDAPDADQMLGCAGVVARRCLAILHAVATVTPFGGNSDCLLESGLLAALVRLLAGRYRSTGSAAEVQRDAAELVLLLSREAVAAAKLAAAGAGPVLCSIAAQGDGCLAAWLASEALQLLQRHTDWQSPQQQNAFLLQRSASSTNGASPGSSKRSKARAASAPSLLPAVPEQRQATQHFCDGGQPAADASWGIARVQQWQRQQRAAFSQEPPLDASPNSRTAAGPGTGLGGGPGRASAAGLVAALYSSFPRSQLAAAEQAAALAASGARAAAVVSAAGGAQALAWCVAHSAAGPVSLHDTLHDAFEAALREGLCTAALRALCTLCQQVATAAEALPPVAPSLRLLQAAPDPQQRQLASMLLASMPPAGTASGSASAGPAPSSGQPGQAGSAALKVPAAAPAAPLPSPPLSGAASVEAIEEETPTTVLRRHPITPASSLQLSQGAATFVHKEPPSSDGSGTALQGNLPSRARCQLAQLLRMKPPHPAAAGGWLEDSASALLSQPWGTASAESAHHAAVQGQPPQDGSAPDGSGKPATAGSSTTAQAATDVAGALGSMGPRLGRCEIIIMQVGAILLAGHWPQATLALGEELTTALVTTAAVAGAAGCPGEDWQLGDGGSGVVLKGLMNGVDEVAVKCIKAATPSEAELASFHREVALLASLRHRNIYYGACLEPGSRFIVTELMRGGDLYAALRRHPDALRWERLGRRVALDVALGLNYLHSRQPPLSHRDLKSPNVLLSEEGVSKIADVAMSRPHPAAQLATAQPLMTPLWAAPEVLRRERADVKADVWSYGLLVWELVSGKDIADCQPLALSRAMSAAAQQDGSGQAAAVSVVEMPAGAAPVAAHIFAECTQLDPSLRPNMQQIVEWLRG